MSAVGEFEMQSKSGTIYTFTTYKLDTSFEKQAAVYVVARQTQCTPGKIGYEPLYLGEAENMQNWNESHNKTACFQRHAADHIGIYPVPDNMRKLIYDDLLKVCNCICNR